MSFCVDLWNGLSMLKSHFSSTFNKVNALNNILLSYASYQKSYSKGLESIYNSYKDLIKEEDFVLDKNISLLINSIKLEGEYHREHYKFIKHNVASSLKEIYDREKSSASNEFSEGQQTNDTFQKIKNNLINKQKNYNNAYKDFFSFMSSFDESQLNIILEIDSCKFHSSVSSDLSNVKISSSKNVNAELLSYNIENKINEITEPNKNMDNNINIDKQIVSKKQKLFDKIHESQKEYTAALDEANDFLNVHKIKLEKVLNSLETKYYSLIRGMHWDLSTLLSHKVVLVNKDYSLYKSYIDNNLNNINDENEVNEFIIKNATKEFPTIKFDFNPYKLENKSAINQRIYQFIKDKLEILTSNDAGRSKSRKKNEINDFKRRVFKKKNTTEQTQNILVLENNMKNFKSKSNMYLIEDFFEEVITDKDDNNKMEGMELSTNFVDNDDSIMKDLNRIKLLLIDEKSEEYLSYLNTIIKVINKYRAKGNFELIKKSYEIFIDIFNFLLNHFSNLDFLLKNIIIFSQTFYYLDNNKNKIFLQYGLKDHLILSKSETWHRVINFTLSGHISNKDISIIDKKETNSKLHILALNTLVAYLCDLKYFSEDVNLFNKVKNFYVRVYQLDEQTVINEVNSLLNSSQNEKKEE